ncbi:ATP-dependent DNA helicase RecG [Arachidicoccus terrestris]|uniref:ATP-dependent DNA helicase RecG n=1 Tax=Arachidicoccus terrestris TaxID=2875539 RepID=UPI001CC38E4D|nr:ATP-dependent DNA helicase RecG [Arachidicoccus terrestris]UAY55797.1 ATP-dependent DNA helicase RecG [Arachidicoccus terrestris]
MQNGSSVLQNPIEYLKGVGPLKGDLLRKELSIHHFEDLLYHFPIRHIDRTKINSVREINPATDYVQLKGKIAFHEMLGQGRSKRLVAEFRDGTGAIELVWFQGAHWVAKLLEKGGTWLIYGKVSFFNGKAQMSHPEMESAETQEIAAKAYLEPIYPSTEKLKTKGLNGRQIGKLTLHLLQQLSPRDLAENIPDAICQHLQLMPRFQAYCYIHFPPDDAAYKQALRRLKFEELFIAQVRLNLIRVRRGRHSKGLLFDRVGDLFNIFYEKHLPFALTGAQKRVLREIRQDTAHGHQMNRLLQGDVGSGKTIVALLSMLMAADNGFQSCLMAPTEILAAQHFSGLSELLKDLPIELRLLTGSTKAKDRRAILAGLLDGTIHMVIGTHAVIEDKVVFKNLGLAIVDEQHRFGVAQRARLWKKSVIPPHILVMTATPIPRTLAMTAYGDLDYSVMDELPPGRQPVTTLHRTDIYRMKVMEFIRSEIDKGRQAYVIYPLIEESEKLSYEDLMQGYEQVKTYFPDHRYKISMVHGRQSPEEKATNMDRFVRGDTQIMVSTTVIEVGVNVPNASVMVIESAEKFGLSQLHQLRGRVGRGAEKSYCILLTGNKLSQDARERIGIMCATNDGFKIAEKDLELRGPGDIEGTRQSGALNLKLASLVEDAEILQVAKKLATALVESDEHLEDPAHAMLRGFLMQTMGKTAWSKIS